METEQNNRVFFFFFSPPFFRIIFFPHHDTMGAATPLHTASVVHLCCIYLYARPPLPFSPPFFLLLFALVPPSVCLFVSLLSEVQDCDFPGGVAGGQTLAAAVPCDLKYVAPAVCFGEIFMYVWCACMHVYICMYDM